MITNLTHSEICAVAASRIGGNTTAETISKHVQGYAKTCFELMNERGPTNEKDQLLVETPLTGYRVKYHATGTKKNPDGTETKIGPNRTISVALPNALLKLINTGLVKAAGQIISAVSEMKKAA